MTTIIRGSATTASTPAISGTDGDTGVFFPAADTVAITTGGTERMRITADGKAGIQNTGPSDLFTINSNKNYFDDYTSAAYDQSVLLNAPANEYPSFIVKAWGGAASGGTTTPFQFGVINLYKQRGTLASPLSTENGDNLGELVFRGWNSTLNGWSGAMVRGLQTGATTSTGNPTSLQFVTNDGANQYGTERMRIDGAGNVGIGTASLNSRLTVDGTTGNWSASNFGKQLLVYGSLTNPTIGIFDANNANPLAITNNSGAFVISAMPAITDSSTSPTERMRITADGEVYIAGTTDRGAFNLQCNGTGVWGAGAYTNGSDAALKHDIETLETGLETINKIRPVTFKYRNDLDYTNDTHTQVGFIAQELQKALEGEAYKDATVITGNEYLSVAYQNFIPILTKAIQEQQAMIEDLAAQVKALQNVQE